jgi:catechol 2,3-dioxygenase-like lactoylglutathione lyase family enzyme
VTFEDQGLTRDNAKIASTVRKDKEVISSSDITMPQSVGLVSVVVRDYDEAIAFYVEKLGFSLVEDTYQAAQDKRWVVVSPPGASESRILLARATNALQQARIGDQTGGRVFLFLYTDDFWRDFNAYRKNGVTFVREPKREDYGTVAVFQDLYGNRWDLIQSAHL